MSTFTHEYERDKPTPVPSDELYPHLADLASALSFRLATERGRWLDYGTDDSTYRAFLEHATVDVAGVRWPGVAEGPSHPAFTYAPGTPCPAPTEAYDGVLSVQVLEHVEDVQQYLRDALRMLRGGGQLILTTHGAWEDHPCPLDLWRWTVDGLRLELNRAGFVVMECLPLTWGPRCMTQLAIRHLPQMRVPVPSLRHPRLWATSVAIRLAARLVRRNRALLNQFADRYFRGDPPADTTAILYSAMIAVARKPAQRREVGVGDGSQPCVWRSSGP